MKLGEGIEVTVTKFMNINVPNETDSLLNKDELIAYLQVDVQTKNVPRLSNSLIFWPTST